MTLVLECQRGSVTPHVTPFSDGAVDCDAERVSVCLRASTLDDKRGPSGGLRLPNHKRKGEG